MLLYGNDTGEAVVLKQPRDNISTFNSTLPHWLLNKFGIVYHTNGKRIKSSEKTLLSLSRADPLS